MAIDKSKSCTFNRGGKCALAIPFSMCERCMAYHPKEINYDAMRERLHLERFDN